MFSILYNQVNVTNIVNKSSASFFITKVAKTNSVTKGSWVVYIYIFKKELSVRKILKVRCHLLFFLKLYHLGCFSIDIQIKTNYVY